MKRVRDITRGAFITCFIMAILLYAVLFISLLLNGLLLLCLGFLGFGIVLFQCWFTYSLYRDEQDYGA